MSNSETKYQNASEKMIKAFLSLVELKDFLDINVKEICRVADVHRSTFYAHYDTTIDLLEDAQNYCVQLFFDEFNKTKNDSGAETLYNKNLISEEYLVPYLSFIKSHRRIYEIYTGKNFARKSKEMFQMLFDRISLPIYHSLGGDKESYALYYTKFYIEGINAVVKEWIKQGFKESEKELAQLIESTIPINNKA